jgi:hypothetical protein
VSTTGDKAKRETVSIGGQEVDGFQMPDGSYRMSQAGAAGAISESPVYALRFLASKDSKSLLGEGYTDYTPESIEVEKTSGGRGQTRINALPLEVVSAYWLYRAVKGNKRAMLLTWALLTESLERRFDAAFGVERSESERNALLTQRLQQTQSQLDLLGEAYAEPDLLREENEQLRQQLRANGIEPWQRIEGGET